MVSILEHIKVETLDNLCDDHYNHILSPTKANHLIRYELSDIINNHNSYSEFQRGIIAHILSDDIFEELIKGKPDHLEEIINYFRDEGYNEEIRLHKDFRVAILNAFGYSKFRGWAAAAKLAQGLDLKSCPYCNAQYTLVTKEKAKNKLLFQLDHFYPKKLYPYLSMSFYNLIPSCGSCNISKSANDSRIADSYHPYVNESLLDDFKFETNNLDVAEAYLTKQKQFEIIINEQNLPQKTLEHLDNYSIKKLFKRHSDIVEELVWKKYIYTEKYKQNLIKTYFDHGHLSKGELERLIIGNYADRKDTHRRPLSKFTSDIARDLGLLK